MKIKDVAKLPPMERLIYWITERESVRIKKESGKPKPWTDDQILQRFRFCNVRRKDDKVSRWLIENWYTPYKNHPNALLACTLARQLNNPESLDAVGFPTEWRPQEVQYILESRATQGLKNYSAAYMITGGYGPKSRDKQTKPYQTVHIVCSGIQCKSSKVNNCSMSQTHSALIGSPGFSSFISGQVTADLRFAVDGLWRDRLTWMPMGPGSVRGLNRLAGREVNSPITYAQFQLEAKLIRHAVVRGVCIDRLEGIDVQGCLCEFDKYERVLWGQGKPKQKYDGV